MMLNTILNRNSRCWFDRRTMHRYVETSGIKVWDTRLSGHISIDFGNFYSRNFSRNNDHFWGSKDAF